MKFRPCIDLHHGKVKQIVGSTLGDGSHSPVENYVSPHNAAYYGSLFKADGLSGGHVIMLGPGNQSAAMEALRAYPGGLQVGGGINPENAFSFLEQGASHVIITSYLFIEGKFSEAKLQQCVAAVGKERLVLDLSCRRREDGLYYVVTDRWQTFTDCALTLETLAELAGYCDEFLIHGVDAEGKRQGILEDLVAFLGKSAPIPTTYAGGVRSFADLELIRRLGRGKIDVTIGSALDIFGGNLSYREMAQKVF